MSAQIRDLTTDLRQLLAAATPGPFTVSSDTGALANLQSLHRLTPGKDGWRERVASNMRSADAALIAGVLNALPVLLDALDEAEEARARAAELETFVRDLAAHGLRCDLTPTMDFASAERLYTRLTSYLRDVDTSLRERAQEAIARADREDRR